MSAANHTVSAPDGVLSNETFKFPPRYQFPPMWTSQPTLATRNEQLKWWSSLIQSYCAHHHRWKLSLTESLDEPLFHNARINKRLTYNEVTAVLDWMCSDAGGRRAEWIGREGEKASAWVYWRRPEEWGEGIAKWVDETGQKNTVLTLYELSEGDAARGQDFYGMDPELMQKALQVLVGRGKAQIFGSDDEQGVKIF